MMNTNPHSRHEPVTEEDLLRFVDNELSEERRADVLAHLAANPGEADRIEAYLHQSTNLRLLARELDLGDAPFQIDLQEQLVAAIKRRTLARRLLRTAAALSLIGGVGFGTLWLTREAPVEQVATSAAPTSPMAVEHRFPFGVSLASADLQTEIGGKVEDPIPWLAEHLVDHSLRKPELDAVGLRLVGGSTLSDTDTPAIRLVYRDELNQNLFLYAGVVAASSDYAFAPVPEGYLSLHWRRGPLVFALVAPRDSPQLLEVVRLVSDGVAQVEAGPDAAIASPALQEVAMPQAEGEVITPAPRPQAVDDAAGNEALEPVGDPEAPAKTEPL